MRQEQPYSWLPRWLKVVTVITLIPLTSLVTLAIGWGMAFAVTLAISWIISFATQSAVPPLSGPALLIIPSALVVAGLVFGELLERSRRNRKWRLGSSSGSDIDVERLKDVGKHPTGRSGISE